MTRAVASLARADRVIAGGALNQLALPGGERRIIARGSGARVWDTEGREYIDHVLGSGPLILGHAHPAVVEAVERQLALGSTFYGLTEPAIELAERIVSRAPCAELVQFCNSGAEATFYALRIARAATGRDAVLKFEGGFHGSNDYALMSLFPTGAPDYPRADPTSSGIPHALVDEVLVSPFNDLEHARAIVERHAARLAAIIVEPVQRVIEPLPGFLAGLRELASRHGIVLVFDEVVTGFRLAPGGAQERYGVTADLAAYGKIIGGGHPLAAVAGRADLMRLADHRLRGRHGYVYISGTLNGNPVAATAGLATLDVLDDRSAYERLEAVGERMRTGLRDAFSAAGVPVQVLGVGPLFQVVVSAEEVREYRALRRGDRHRIRRVAQRVFDGGVYLTAEKNYLSLAHTDEDVDRVVEAFAEALRADAHTHTRRWGR
jgi:glutamate-1-semialdehyde 2,1-aminomutase